VKPLRARLQDARRRLGLPWEVIERDYLLSWILAGITEVKSLRDALVFKGGNALKKCYFGDYRFSEDLDFSGVGSVPVGIQMETAIREACATATKLLDEYAPVEMVCERYTEREPHPGRQEAFTIRARLPWQRQPQTRVIVETAIDETVLKPPNLREIIHEYGEPLRTQVLVYSLEEIVAEKLRTIFQHIEKLEERGGHERASPPEIPASDLPGASARARLRPRAAQERLLCRLGVQRRLRQGHATSGHGVNVDVRRRVWRGGVN
jgi:predicted nucleotidyltransferase component of viral defense system